MIEHSHDIMPTPSDGSDSCNRDFSIVQRKFSPKIPDMIPSGVKPTGMKSATRALLLRHRGSQSLFLV
jgi:hypothetical protein